MTSKTKKKKITTFRVHGVPLNTGREGSRMARRIKEFLNEAEDGDLYTTDDLVSALNYASPLSIRNGIGSYKSGVLTEYRILYCGEQGRKTYWGNKDTIAALKELPDGQHPYFEEEEEKEKA